MKKFLLPGLLAYAVISGLGLFLTSGVSSPLLIPWLTGYLFLVFAVSYVSLFSKERPPSSHFIILGILGLNFLVQLTGGSRSPLVSVYFLLAAASVFQPTARAYSVAALVLGIEAANLLMPGQADAADWKRYAGFAASLAGTVLLVTPIISRIKNQASIAGERYQKLLADASAVDPLADGTKLDELTEQKRQTANISIAVEREGAFKGLIDMIYEMVPAHTYALFLADGLKGAEAEDGSLTLRAIRSESRHVPAVGTIHVPRRSGLIGISAEKNQPQYLPDVVISARNLGYYTQDVPVKSFLAIPVSQGERTVGVLVVDSLERDAFSLDTQDLLTRFAPFFSQIIEKIRISQELDLRAKNAAALHEMSSTLNRSLELNEVLSQLTQQMRIVVPYDFCAFVLYEKETGEMEVAAQHGYDPAVVGRRFMPEQSAILNQMHRQWEDRNSLQSYDFPDLGGRGKDIDLFPVKEMQRPLQSLYCLPLVAREKFIGSCVIGSLRSNALTRYQKDFIDTLMNQVSLVIDNARLHRSIRDMARTDGLTGLLNHRTFMEKLSEEFKRLGRDPTAFFSLLLADIDFFKKVNDTYGHPAGDAALVGVAKALTEVARGADFVARYGGEEFAVGMVGADSTGARQTAERLRKIVEKTSFTIGKNTEISLTLSFGVASYPEDAVRIVDLIAMADQALYYAKHTGRNRVCLYRDVKGAESP